MTRGMTTGRPIGNEDDFTRWDETIFDRCLKAGFNPFGSGPTPVFPQPSGEEQSCEKPNVRLRADCKEDDRQ
ncbi:hypothetical protein D3C80_680070 [compost metagenome]